MPAASARAGQMNIFGRSSIFSDVSADVDKGNLSVNTLAYHSIKKMILSNTLRPGNKLTHQELAAMLGVSRTPIREALERLLQEGFVTHKRRRGFFVADISESDAHELLGVREALELYALQHIVDRQITIDLDHLSAINESYSRAIRDGSTKQRMLIDREFHTFIARHAGNEFLVSALDTVFERLVLTLRTDGYSVQRGEEAYQEHVELSMALHQRDHELAQRVMRAHIQASRERLLEQLDVMNRDTNQIEKLKDALNQRIKDPATSSKATAS